MSTTRRLVTIVTVFALVVWVALAIAAYDRLPETIATHFSGSGSPDGFSQRSIMSWFALTIIGVFTTGMILGIAQLTHAHPSMYNVPGKEKLLALPPEAQTPLLEQLATWMALLALSIVMLLGAIQYDMWRVATMDQQGLSALSWWALGIDVVGFFVLMPLFLMRFSANVNKAAAVNLRA